MSTAPAKSFVILLREHLEAEITVHRRLLALAEARTVALTANDRAQLAKLNEDESIPAAESARLRACRDRLVQGLAERLAVPPDQVRLSRLIEMLPDPNRRELAERRVELATLLTRLREVVERNDTLARTALSIVRTLLRTIAGAPASGHYDRRGGEAATASSGSLIDARG